MLHFRALLRIICDKREITDASSGHVCMAGGRRRSLCLSHIMHM